MNLQNRLWRKTRQPHFSLSFFCTGADPNRNFDFHHNGELTYYFLKCVFNRSDTVNLLQRLDLQVTHAQKYIVAQNHFLNQKFVRWLNL